MQAAVRTGFGSLKEELIQMVRDAEQAAVESLAGEEQAIQAELQTHDARTQGPKYDLDGDAEKSKQEVLRYLKSQKEEYSPAQTVTRLQAMTKGAEEKQRESAQQMEALKERARQAVARVVETLRRR